MNRTKRFLVMLLAVCMLVSAIPTVFAAAPSSMTIAKLASASEAVATTLQTAIKAGTAANGVYSNVVVPSAIAVGGYTMGVEDYILMAAQAINDIDSGAASSAAITYKNVTLAADIAQGASATSVSKGMIVDLARRVEKYGLAMNELPTSFNRPSDGSTTYEGRLCIYSIGSIFAQALASYAKGSKLPTSVTFAPSSYTTSQTSAPQVPEEVGLPVSDEYAAVIEAAVAFKDYVDKNEAMPSTIKVGSTSYGPSAFSHLIAQVIVNINNGETSSALEILKLSEPSNPNETSVATTITKTEYLDLASRTITWNRNNGVGANYMNSSIGHIHHHEAIYLYCQVLAYYAENVSLPATAKIYTWAKLIGVTAGDATFGNNFSAYSKFLVPTNNCPSTNATIISVAKTGMMYSAGAQGGYPTPTSTYQAMFNLMEYINDKTDYEYYTESHRGALKTWNDKQGNCCDMAHLVNACARSLGVPGKYEHWYTSVGGHVWASLYCPDAPNPNINGTKGWLYADPVNNANYLGYQTHTNYSEYGNSDCAELPF